ncbi:hypothetical protein, partial [Mitsuokella multacida]|uniref:hypothetical protein n=1 Tax=Mitsuokella multacida TaxID=52226 RepID=UPI003F7F8744
MICMVLYLFFLSLLTSYKGKGMVSGFGAQLNGLHASFARQSVFAAYRGVLTSDCLAPFAWRPVLRTVASLLQADTIPFPS